MSLVRLAQICGLGKIGKNGLLYSASFGPRLMIGGIVTAADIPELTWPERDEQGCPETCFVCRDVCPAKAIDRQAKVDRVACAKYSMGSPLLSLAMAADNGRTMDMATVFNPLTVDGNSLYKCTLCVSECPK